MVWIKDTKLRRATNRLNIGYIYIFITAIQRFIEMDGMEN